MYYEDFPPGRDSDDAHYYIIFGRVTTDAVQMFLGHVKKGDDEYDELAKRLGLQSFSFTADDFETAEEWAKKDAELLHPSLPVEIRFMEDGDLSALGGMFRLPVDAEKPLSCKTCGIRDQPEHWLSVGKFGHPVFCSHHCGRIWYEEIPFRLQPPVSGLMANG